MSRSLFGEGAALDNGTIRWLMRNAAGIGSVASGNRALGTISPTMAPRQIAEIVTGFFSILAEWAQAETPTSVGISVDEWVRHDR